MVLGDDSLRYVLFSESPRAYQDPGALYEPLDLFRKLRLTVPIAMRGKSRKVYLDC